MRLPKHIWGFLALLLLGPIQALALNGLQAHVAAVVGKASVKTGEADYRPLRSGDPVREGDWVQLETQKSRLVLKVSDGTEIRLKGRTRVKFASLRQDSPGATKKIQFALSWGKFWAKVSKLTTRESKFEVKAGGVICGVRGTVLGGEYDPDQGHGAFYNFEGHVYLDDGKGPHELHEGTHAGVGGGTIGGEEPNHPGDSQDVGGPAGPAGNPPSNDLSDLIEDLGGGSQDGAQRMLVDEGHLGVLLGFNVPEGGP